MGAKNNFSGHTEAELTNAMDLARDFAEEYKIYNLSGMVSISSIGVHDENDKHNKDLCIVVNWQKKLSESVSLPPDYKGMRVFYKFIGKIRPLK